jgi:hypothetical protein
MESCQIQEESMAIIQLPSAAYTSPRKSGKPFAGDETTVAPKGLGKVAQIIDAIAQFIPADLLAIYISGMDFLSPLPLWGEWAVVGTCILLVPVLFALGTKLPAIADAPVSPEKSTLRILMGVSVLAFVVWVSALPHGPFARTWGDDISKIGIFIALVLSVVLPLGARRLKLMK